MRAQARGVSLLTMHTNRRESVSPPRRVLIVDGHEVSRVACAALLRTEGLDVVDLKPNDDVIELARQLEPDVVLIDAATENLSLAATARALRALPCGPVVLLTSSATRDGLDRSLASLPFVPKADICASEIAEAVLDEAARRARSG